MKNLVGACDAPAWILLSGVCHAARGFEPLESYSRLNKHISEESKVALSICYMKTRTCAQLQRFQKVMSIFTVQNKHLLNIKHIFVLYNKNTI